jgi:hypothetical protein
MSRSHLAIFPLNVDINGPSSRTFRSHSGPPTSLIGSTRMRDYPTPPRTQSPATSISGSSAPPTPSQGLGLHNFPFPSTLVGAYSAAASSSSYLPATSIGDWSLPTGMCGRSYEESSRVDLPAASHPISNAGLDAIAFYSPPAVLPSSSMTASSATIDFALTQHSTPVMFNGNFQWGGCPPVKREEDAESWFNDHVNMGRSQSSIDLSPYGNLRSPSLSSSRIGSAGAVPSPGIGFAALSPASGRQRQQLELLPTSRSGSDESGIAFQPLASNRTPGKGRRDSVHSERRYICAVCSRAFDKKYNLREHEKKHDPSRTSQFACPEPGCGKRLGRKTDVNRHVQSVHEKAKKFACTKCYKRFDRKDTLSR